mgnify:CR=1 FL=1
MTAPASNTTTTASTAPTRSMNTGVVVVAAIALVGLGYGSHATGGGRMLALLAVGGALGISLFHASFGFTGSWRSFLVERRGAGVRSQMAMFAVASAAFLPLLEWGSPFGGSLGGAVAPAGVSVIVGAFLFGVGMQLGGSCASGSLYVLGGGRTRTAVTLVFFMAGSLLGSLHLPWWLTMPRLPAISLQGELGTMPALLFCWGVFGSIALTTKLLERRAAEPAVTRQQVADGPVLQRLVRGPWPLLAGGMALAALNVATLLISGHPWSVSFGYALWGAKAATALGIDVAAWSFWTWPYPKAALAGGLLDEDTSVMNFGILAGAFLAAGLAGRFAPLRRVPPRQILAAIVGGLLMGYGARLAFGCNIGALFSGIASGSLHGWLWLVCGVAGNALGVHLRPRFGLANT